MEGQTFNRQALAQGLKMAAENKLLEDKKKMREKTSKDEGIEVALGEPLTVTTETTELRSFMHLNFTAQPFKKEPGTTPKYRKVEFKF